MQHSIKISSRLVIISSKLGRTFGSGSQHFFINCANESGVSAGGTGLS